MKRNFTPYIYTILFLGINYGIFAQKLNLKLIALKNENQIVLDSLKHKSNFNKKEGVFIEINKVLESLKRKGYLTSILIKSELKNNTYIGTIGLGKKTTSVVVYINDNQKRLLDKKTNLEKILIEEIEDYRKSISSILINKGIPFSEVIFSNYRFQDLNLEVDLIINRSKERVINKVIIKGYENFPQSFTKYYLNLNNKTPFSSSIIKEVEDKIKDLSFAELTKKSETLFKRDSTILYIHLKKLNKNSVDALINLGTDNSNSFQFNGIIDLSLNNIFNKGESFKIYWNRVGNNQSEFKLENKTPYVFKSKFSSEIDFNIYRQDSTFLNTNTKIRLTYPINKKINIGLGISYLSSTQIDNSNTNLGVIDFSTTAIQSSINSQSKRKSFNNQNLFNQELSFILRNRNTDTNNISQSQINYNLISNIELSSRSILYLNSSTQLLFSKNYLVNEIFRIGGINSIRGFNEQSIFANKYSVINTEYRYYTSQSNYLHTITDLSWFENIEFKNKLLYSLGFGYSFTKANNQLNLAYVLGGGTDESLDLGNSRLIVKFITFF